MRKDHASILRHFVTCQVPSKSSSFPGLLKAPSQNVTGVMKIYHVRLYCSKKAEENPIKLLKCISQQQNDENAAVFCFRKLSVVRNDVKLFFSGNKLQNIHGYDPFFPHCAIMRFFR